MTYYPTLLAKAFSVSLCAFAFAIVVPLNATQVDEKSALATPESMAFVAQNVNESAENRAQALRFISQYPSQNSLITVARALKDNNALVREAAIEGVTPYPLAHRYRMVSPLLDDQTPSVQLAATVHLLKDFEQLQMGEQAVLRSHADRLITQLSSATSYDQQLLLADVYRWSLRPDNAQAIYQQLLNSKDKTSTLFLNFSNNYYAQGDNNNALKVLEQGVVFDDANASIYYAKALTLVRLDNKQSAAESMDKAVQLAPKNAYYWYLNGVLQEPLDINASIQSFEQAYLISGAPENLYAMCDIYIRNDHKNTEQCMTALTEVAPEDVINDLRRKQVN